MYPDKEQLNSSNDLFHVKRLENAEKLGKMGNEAQKSLSNSFKSKPTPERRESYAAKSDENLRELAAHYDVNSSRPLSEYSGDGVSGDALARAKKGQTPVLHRTAD